MESFSSLNRKFSIKCYSKSFQKNIIDKFPPNKENLIDTLHIGFKNIPDEIINYKIVIRRDDGLNLYIS